MPGNVQLLDHLQLQKLQDALLAAFPEPNAFEEMLFFRTGNHMAQIAPIGADLRHVIYTVITTAQSDGWIRMLVVGAHQHNPGQPLLRQFVAAVFPEALIGSANDTTFVDPTEACFLSEDRGLAFIDRRQLRDGLKALTQPGLTPRVLAVHSDLSRCGKSYTAEFIRFVALHRQQRVAYIDLREDIFLGDSLQELVAQLARKIRLNDGDSDDIPKEEAQKARWVRQLVIWLIDEIRRSGHFFWLVFDSINQVNGLPGEFHDFIGRLARQLEIEEFDPPCRLVLISYRGREQLPLEIRQRVVQDEIRMELGSDQLKEFFEDQVRMMLGGDANDDEVRGAVDVLCSFVQSKLAVLPADTRPFAISNIVHDALRELEASQVVEEEVG